MVISKRLFSALVVLAAAGVGAVMYTALLASGIQGTAASTPAAAPETRPVRVTLDASTLEGLCPPVILDARGSEGGVGNTEVGDFATNSGVVNDSLFNDGGFGDIGQQWREVMVMGPVTNVHIGGDGNSATVTVGGPAPSGSGSSGASGGGGTGTAQTPPTTSPTTTPTTAPAEDDVAIEVTDEPTN
jgi:hypothetical protein